MTQSRNHLGRQSLLATALALVAGYIDAFALLRYNVFTSFMSGNTTQSGAYTGQRHFPDAALHFLPIPFFVLGIFVGTLSERTDDPRPLRLRCAVVSILLAFSLFAINLDLVPRWADIAILSAAMGMMNTTITKVGRQAIGLGFVTGDLNHLGRHCALAVRGKPVTDPLGEHDTHWRRAMLLACVWVTFFLGALLAAVIMGLAAEWTLVPPIALLVFTAIHGGTNEEPQQRG